MTFYGPIYDTTGDAGQWPSTGSTVPNALGPCGNVVHARLVIPSRNPGADDARMEQERREAAWRQFQRPGPVVRTFSPERVVERPERHARSNPRRE